MFLFVCFAPLSCSNIHVLLKAMAVEPRFATVDVAYIYEVAKRTVFRAAVPFHDEHMVLGRKSHGDGIVECGWRVVGAPVHGVDADAGFGNDGFDVAHMLHGVVADGHSRVVSSLCGTYVSA